MFMVGTNDRRHALRRRGGMQGTKTTQDEVNEVKSEKIHESNDVRGGY